MSAEDAEVEIRWNQAENIVPLETGIYELMSACGHCGEAPESLFPENRMWDSQALFHTCATLQGTEEAMMFSLYLSIPAHCKEPRVLLSQIKTPGCLSILLLSTRCVHILKENWQVEESLPFEKILEAYQTLWRPVPKISLEVAIC